MRYIISRDEAAEIDDLLSDALNGSRTVGADSVARALDAIESADQAGRLWPDALRAKALYDWIQNRQKNLAKAEKVVNVAHNGKVVSKSIRVGKRVKRDDGTSGYQQSLLNDFTWPELETFIAETLTRVDGLEANVTMAQQLLKLRDRFPQTAGPAEACALLGTTVEGYLDAAATA